MSAGSLLPWLIAPGVGDDCRDVELIAGEDPYAWKRTASLTTPYVRPEDPVRAAQVLAAIGAAR